MLWNAGEQAAARALFARGAAVPRSYQHPPLYDAWSRCETEAGDLERAGQLRLTYQHLLAQPPQRPPRAQGGAVPSLREQPLRRHDGQAERPPLRPPSPGQAGEGAAASQQRRQPPRRTQTLMGVQTERLRQELLRQNGERAPSPSPSPPPPPPPPLQSPPPPS